MNLMVKRTLVTLCLGATALAGGAGPAPAAQGAAAMMSYATGYTETVVSGAGTPVETPGHPRISDQKAIEILKGAFPDLEWSEEPQISASPGRGPAQPAWNISVSRANRYGVSPGGFHARVDGETGDILDLFITESASSAAGDIISKEKARSVAEDLVHRLQPDKLGLLRFKAEQYPGSYYYGSVNSLNLAYSFYWERRANGLAVDGDGLSVSVDALSGRVVSYSYNWRPNLALLPATPAISAGEAAEGLLDKAGLYLAYYVPDNDGSAPNEAPRARLVYRLNSSSTIIDALSGQVLDYQGSPLENPRQFGEIPGTQGELNPPAAAGQRISPADALEKAKKFFRELGYGEKVQQNGQGSGSGSLGREEFWNFTPAGEEPGGYYDSSPDVGIEVFTGRVVRFSNRGYKDSSAGENKNITREEARETALSFVRKIEPQLYDHLAPDSDILQVAREPYHSFRFSRVANGIVFPQDGVSITVGPDGKIVDYRCNWHRVDFPPAGATISPADAAALWLEKSPLELAYFFPMDQTGRPLPARPVYRPAFGGLDSIDAASGEPLGWNGKPAHTLQTRGYDFSGSWAGQQLQLLANSGLLPPPDSFSPGSPAARRDGIRLIMADMGSVQYDDQPAGQYFSDITPGDPDYNVLQRAATLEVIEKGGQFLPGEPLDRRTLAQWLVNRLKYREVAAIPGLIESPFRDISGLPLKDRNCIGLVSGLGLMSGDGGGDFRPLDSVTWEELAAVVLKLPPRLQGRDMMY